MVIGPDVVSNVNEWAAGQIATLQAIPGILEAEFLELASDVVEPRLSAITRTPGPRGSNRFVWSGNAAKNRAAQRFFFAAVNSGRIRSDGRHYARSGEPPYGFRVDVDSDNDGVFLALYSDWDNFNFVFGNPLTGRGQLIGHRQTGWLNVKRQLDDLFYEVNLLQIKRLNQRLVALHKRPAFGRGRR